MRSLSLFAGTSLSILLAAGAANAQGADTSSTNIEEVIVTAQKRAENLQDVPISISAVSAEQIQRAGVATLEAVQRLTPGLNMTAVGSGFVSYSYLRGAGTNVLDSGADPSVAFFIDEVYLTGTAGLQFELLDLERIEVLKGPQGTLFGRNAAAGAISVITKRAEDRFNAYASVDVGNYDLLSVKGGITGPLTEDGAWRYRLSAAHRERGAFTENPAGRDPGSIDNYTARASLEYHGEKLNFRLTGDYFTSDNAMTNHFLSTTSVVGFLSPTTVLPADQSMYRRYYNVDGFEKQDTYMLAARLEYDLGFATLTSISAYRDNHFKRLQDQDGTVADGYSLASDQQDISFSQEVRLAGDGERFRWIAGLYYYHNRTDRRDVIDSGPDFALPVARNQIGVYGQNIHTKSFAVFGQATYDFTDQLSLTLGGRYTKDEKISVQATDPFTPGPNYFVRLTPDWDSFDPSATLEFQATDDIMLYASAKQGFKSGGFQTLPGSAALASTVYNPERVRAYELGARTQWWDGRLTANVTLFHADIQNQQILRIPSAGLSIIDNASATKTDGVDFSLGARVMPRLRLDLNGTIQKARFKKYVSGGVSFEGNRQLRSPDVALSFVGEYSLPLGEVGDLLFRGEYSYQSKIFFDAANTSSPNAFQPAYGLVNARVIYTPTDANWDASLFVKNWGGKKYFRNIAISGPSGLGTPGDPLTAGVTINWRLH